MNTTSNFWRVRAIIAEELGVDPEKITLESDLVRDFGADSLDTICIVMECEDAFNVFVPDEEIEALTTPQKIVNWLEKNEAQA